MDDLVDGFAGSPMTEVLQEHPELDDGRSLVELFRRSARRSPGGIACVASGREVTYAELDAAVMRIASQMVERGRRPGERVLLHLVNGLGFVESFLGCVAAGCVPVLTLPGHGRKELLHLSEVSGAAELVGDDPDLMQEVAEGLAGQGLPRPATYCGSLPEAAEPLPAIVDVDPATPALLLVSGGTTGMPKLIPRTHQDYAYTVRTAIDACGFTSDDVYLAALPMGHNFPLASPGMLGVLALGGTVVCCGTPSPDEAFDLIERWGVTVTSLVPPLAAVWAEATAWEPADLGSLRLLQVGGSRLSVDAARTLDSAFGGILQQVFGMAEGLLCFTRPDDPDRGRVHSTQGWPMSPHDVLRIGDDGGLIVSGPYTIRGYYRAPEVNASSFTADGAYCSGDRVELLPDGSVVVTGRIKDVIIRAGENIDCSEVEAILGAAPNVRQVVVVPVPDKNLGEALCAVVVPDGAAEPTLAELRSLVERAGAADFKRPDMLRLVTSIPLTVVGKPDRKRVAAELSDSESR